MLDGVRGQCGGGVRTYFSLSGRMDWMNACLKSAVLGEIPSRAASATRRRNSICERTGAKVSDLDQV